MYTTEASDERSPYYDADKSFSGKVMSIENKSSSKPKTVLPPYLSAIYVVVSMFPGLTRIINKYYNQ